MENKYYTPELEELHVGLEYQFACDATISGVKSIEWLDGNIENNAFIDVLKCPEIIKDTIRVKYLDEEDIREILEDFELIIKDDRLIFRGDFTYRGEAMIAEVLYVPLSKHLLIYIGDDETMVNDFKTLYAGTCKNKSKLKQILKDVGVL